jgi:NADPH:quinone reductase-like Zn-dependent oxidoreductase
MKLGIIPKRKISGADIAGCIESIGDKVTKFRAGDEVFGDISGCGFGGFAEYVSVPEGVLALKPETVSFDKAAAVPLAAVTALQGLRDRGNIQPGKGVLICGAGGGVGTFAVQLAKYFGAEVTAVCSHNNVQLVRSLGADHVINYNTEDFTRNPKQYDLVLVVNGNQALNTYKRLLTSDGVCVMVGGALSQVIKTMLFGAFMSIGGRKISSLAAKPNIKDLEFIIKLVENGKVKPVIERTYPLNETADAVKYISKGHARGKVVINVAQG